ncbi:DNA-binding protein [Fictibacillus phosphorivorans]|uniref:DNA-binding protein n=1 Tax=Fictibacillus phosphorivorans TaxID=1221500 RepID=UPI00203A8E3D|nr:DNA-binding protein [Fictibacillus phosphorivorans]MCM3719011.1 DNA-binding protein [Fictibacillus phosphorivorans]MCM3776633.1 DNA-binding protein [Fictibacillus phosphorivorans]
MAQKSEEQFPPKIAKPAQRALAGAGIASYQELAKKSEKTVSALHGMGPNAMAKLKAALSERGLSFKKE